MRTIWRAYEKMCNKLCTLMLILAGVSLLAMLAVVTIDIIGRNTSLFSPIGGSELAGYFLVAVTFLGLAYSFQNDGFIRVNMLYNRFRGKFRHIVDLVLYLISFTFMIFMTKYCWLLTVQSYVKNIHSQGILQTSLYIPRGVMTLGCVVFLLILLYDIISAVIAIAAGSKSATIPDDPA